MAKGACVVKEDVHGEGRHVWHGAGRERRPRTVSILLECILVLNLFIIRQLSAAGNPKEILAAVETEVLF